jgi:hypothetical protein
MAPERTKIVLHLTSAYAARLRNMLASEVIYKLGTMFPAAFPAEPATPVPLKIGIDADLYARCAEQMSESDIQAALREYTGSERYLAIVVSGQYRRDLDGRLMPKVTALEEHIARVTLFTAQARRLIKELQQRKDIEVPTQPPFHVRIADRTINALLYARTRLGGESTAALQRFARKRALHIAHTMVQASTAVYKVSRTKRRRSELNWSKYFLYVRCGDDDLQNARFDSAVTYFDKADSISRQLNRARLFPNYFIDASDLAVHRNYVGGISAMSRGAFDRAAFSIRSWISSQSDNASRTMRYRDATALLAIMDILTAVQNGTLSNSAWPNLDAVFQELMPSGNVWCLAGHLAVLKALTLASASDVARRQAVDNELQIIAAKWPLMIRDAPADTSVTRPDVIAASPTFFDIFGSVLRNAICWQFILAANFRHIILLATEYRLLVLRELDRARGESTVPPLPLPLECMRFDEIVDLLSTLCSLSLRDAKHLPAMVELVDSIKRAISDRNITRVIHFQTALLCHPNFLPHIVHVTESTINSIGDDSSGSDDHGFRDAIAERLWQKVPTHLIIRRPHERLSQGDYIYLRPSWAHYGTDKIAMTKIVEPSRVDGVRSEGTSAVISRDPRSRSVIRSSLPKALQTLHDSVVGITAYDRDRFAAWFSQIDEAHQICALRLLSGMRHYGPEEVRRLWLRIIDERAVEIARGAPPRFIGLGDPGKSGSLTTYYLRQALLEAALPFRWAIATQEELARGPPATPIVFVDDFIGTGDQAANELTKFLEKWSWDFSQNVYYCALVGYESGRNRILSALQGRIGGVFIGELLSEEDRAFSPSHAIWDRADDRIRGIAKNWAARTGRQLLASSNLDPVEHCLGWRNSQSLVSFHYNTPDNTLPIFWASGTVDGWTWVPLTDRH